MWIRVSAVTAIDDEKYAIRSGRHSESDPSTHHTHHVY